MGQQFCRRPHLQGNPYFPTTTSPKINPSISTRHTQPRVSPLRSKALCGTLAANQKRPWSHKLAPQEQKPQPHLPNSSWAGRCNNKTVTLIYSSSSFLLSFIARHLPSPFPLFFFFISQFFSSETLLGTFTGTDVHSNGKIRRKFV